MKKLLLGLICFVLFSCQTGRFQNSQKLMDDARKDSIKQDSIMKAADNSINSDIGWKVETYTDEFGEPGKEKFIRNNTRVTGSFSNSATERSPLNVDFLIDGPNSISIQLYEYAGSNPVKSSTESGYSVKVKQGSEQPVRLLAHNYSDRLQFNSSNSKILSKMLEKGGSIKFAIAEISEYSKSTYSFEINNSSGYSEVLKSLVK